MIMIIKFMQEKVKVRWNSMQKNIFKFYRKFKIYFFNYCQKQFFALHNLRWNDGNPRCTAKVCVRDCTLFIEGMGLEIFTKRSLKSPCPIRRT